MKYMLLVVWVALSGTPRDASVSIQYFDSEADCVKVEKTMQATRSEELKKQAVVLTRCLNNTGG